MFHAIYHPNLWNYCQLISLFVSQYQPMINQTLRSSTNKQYSIPTFHLFTKSGDTRQPSNFVLEHLQTSFFHLLPEPSSVYCSVPQKILLCVNFLLKISPGPLPLLSVDHSCLFSWRYSDVKSSFQNQRSSQKAEVQFRLQPSWSIFCSYCCWSG